MPLLANEVRGTPHEAHASDDYRAMVQLHQAGARDGEWSRLTAIASLNPPLQTTLTRVCDAAASHALVTPDIRAELSRGAVVASTHTAREGKHQSRTHKQERSAKEKDTMTDTSPPPLCRVLTGVSAVRVNFEGFFCCLFTRVLTCVSAALGFLCFYISVCTFTL